MADSSPFGSFVVIVGLFLQSYEEKREFKEFSGRIQRGFREDSERGQRDQRDHNDRTGI